MSVCSGFVIVFWFADASSGRDRIPGIVFCKYVQKVPPHVASTASLSDTAPFNSMNTFCVVKPTFYPQFGFNIHSFAVSESTPLLGPLNSASSYGWNSNKQTIGPKRSHKHRDPKFWFHGPTNKGDSTHHGL